ncbi:MAG TPA: ATP-grasp domain-containing protein [Bdellovibrionota bacterium]|nr:ATP-grasp domain-containing protein [Bdellovibrionota bacterium]
MTCTVRSADDNLVRMTLNAGTQFGILGSGQLARMLCEAAHRLGLSPVVLCQNPGDPAAQVCPKAVLGSIKDIAVLKDFFSRVSHVAFENEFVPCGILERASFGMPVRFFPPLRSLAFLQDKLNQKSVLNRLKIPTSRHMIGDLPGNWLPWLHQMLDHFGEGGDSECVLKWAQQGYDGKGTFFLNRRPEILDQAVAFCNEAELRGIRIYAEERITFKRELAIVSCHSEQHGFAHYPLVISEQKNGICHRVWGPAMSLGVAPKLAREARRHAEKLAQALQLYGTFAIEFFESRGGRLLVNEIAPRVHNTGHYTMNASETDQFENHLRAMFDLPLGSTRTAPGFAMQNLLGPSLEAHGAHSVAMPEPTERLHVHWYGKHDLKPGRKLGHVNGVTDSPGKVKKLLAEMESTVEEWRKRARKSNRGSK